MANYERGASYISKYGISYIPCYIKAQHLMPSAKCFAQATQA